MSRCTKFRSWVPITHLQQRYNTRDLSFKSGLLLLLIFFSESGKSQHKPHFTAWGGAGGGFEFSSLVF